MKKEYISVLERIIRIGLFLLPPFALIVGGNFYAKIFMPGIGDLFFPFITAKNFYFRIIVEVIFSLWVVTALFDARFRPKMTPVLWALTATIFVLAISTIFGENITRSFWSNYERMEGLVGHLHLFAFFVVLTSMFSRELDWKKFFGISLGTSFLVASYAYFQSMGLIRIYQSSERLDATLGNSTYLAIYIIFHLFIALYFLLREDKKLLRYVLVGLIVFELPVVFLTATRGAVLGLLGGIVLFGLLWLWQNPRRSHKGVALVCVGIVFVLVGIFWMLRDASFVKQNYVFQRFVGISLTEQTVKSRFTIWDMSIQGFKEHPILGWGLENYSIVFNKYYQPELWPQEQWFDRTHNVIFDWLIAGGLLGLIAYLSIFAAALAMIWKIRDPAATTVIVSLFAVYFFHNLFVFDNLTSYFMFFSVLGFIHFKYILAKPYEKNTVLVPNHLQYTLSALAVIALPFFLYFVNVKPILASQALIHALRDISIDGAKTDIILSDFDQAFSYRTFGTAEAREQLVTYANLIASSQLPAVEKEKVLTKAISEMEKQVSEHPKDVRGYVFLAGVYSNAWRFDKAIEVAHRALVLSPQKQHIMFLVADIYIKKGDTQTALGILEEAHNLDPSFGDAARNYAMALILTGKEARAEEVLKNAFGGNLSTERQIWGAYIQVGNFAKARDLLAVAVERDPANLQLRLNLTAMHLNLGNRIKAIEEIQTAIEIHPQFKEQGEYFINEIRAGRNP